jgi:hypothetical protein
VRVVRSLVLALGATAVAVGVGVLVPDSDETSPPETVDVPSTTLTDFDTTELVAARVGFCDAVPPEAVNEALDGEPIATAAYGNGDRAKVAGTVRDVAHEFSCAWRGQDGTVARAWVFAPPVTPDRAATLVADARKGEGCRPDADAPAYGVPSLALVCDDGGTRLQSYRGLFGDAWLTCQLSVPRSVAPAALEARAGRWCVSVAEAAEARTAG